MRTPQYDMNIFKDRRTELARRMRGAVLILASNPHVIRNNDVHYPYRQDSNFFYLTGFEESDSIFIFRPGLQPETVMFVQPKDPLRETWDGFLYGPEATKNLFGIEEVYTIDKFEEMLPKLVKDTERLLYSLFWNTEVDKAILKTVQNVAVSRSRSNKGNLAIEDSRVVLGEMRIKKSAAELNFMRNACKASSEAHVEVMKACKPGINERALHGVFMRAIMERGAAREGYGSIVASGASATTLHYTFNDQPCKDGDILLIDAGGEFNYYTADITRSYPVNGKFSPAQKRVYGKILDVQKKLVAAVKPNETRENIQKKAIDGLVDIMMDENLLRGAKADIIEKKSFLKYYMHGVGHWLGLDVHDAGLTEIGGEPRPLEEGVCLTIEPGLYIPFDDQDAPKELRGFGVRIEDNILVTATGHENFTSLCPKEIDELEAVIGK
ncbi:MAG: aminopeptidase P family protein [Bdellovibrionota bacterium]